MSTIYFWQQIITPHMAALTAALAERGHAVSYVANTSMSRDRSAQGWQTADVGRARLIIASTSTEVSQAIARAPIDAIHITQGLRGNGLVGVAQRALRRRGARVWVIHEKIDDRGFLGVLKRIVYRLGYRQAQPWLERILAIGEGTDQWAAARGFPRHRISTFAYFLGSSVQSVCRAERPFTFCYAGRLIPLKRVDLLIEALGGFNGHTLEVVGDGPLGPQLRKQAEKISAGEVRWHGTVVNGRSKDLIAEADCLILPSDYDGWGAVVSEALVAGTRVICSSACGAAAAVREDQGSRVFQAGKVSELRQAIAETLGRGKVLPCERAQRRTWASCLAAPAGAAYLEALIEGRPVLTPWNRRLNA